MGYFTFMATYVNLQNLLLCKALWSGRLTQVRLNPISREVVKKLLMGALAETEKIEYI